MRCGFRESCGSELINRQKKRTRSKEHGRFTKSRHTIKPRHPDDPCHCERCGGLVQPGTVGHAKRVTPGKPSKPESKLRMRSIWWCSMTARCTASRAESRG